MLSSVMVGFQALCTESLICSVQLYKCITLTGASWISFTEYLFDRGSAEYRLWKVPLVAKRC